MSQARYVKQGAQQQVPGLDDEVGSQIEGQEAKVVASVEGQPHAAQSSPPGGLEIFEKQSPEGVKKAEEPKDEKAPEKKADPYANNTEDQDLALIKTMLEAKAKEAKAGDTQMQDLALHMQLYTMNPYHLEEYAPLVFGKELELLRGPQAVIWEFLGLTAQNLGDQIGKTQENKDQAANALDRLQRRVIEKVATARQERLKLETPYREKITEIEAKYPKLKEHYQHSTEEEKSKVISARYQLKDAGYSIAQVPWPVFRDTILGRFTQFNKDPEGSLRVLPATTKLSSNDVPNNPQLWQAGGIALWSGGMNAPVYMDLRGGQNMRVMVALGATVEQYQKELFEKAAIIKQTETKDVAKIGTVENATALRSVTKDARQVITDTFDKYLPMPTATLLPANAAIMSYADQKDHWFDTIILGKDRQCAYYLNGHRDIRKDDVRVIHSGDFQLTGEIKTPVSDTADKSYSHQVILQIPKKAGHTSHQYYATASYGGALKKGQRRSWGMYIIDSASQDEINKLANDLQTFANRGGNNDEMPPELIKKIQTLLKDKKPVYSINSTDPFADSGAYGLEMASVYFSEKHQRNFIVRWGIPLKFELEAKAAKMGDMNKLIDGDLERVVESPDFQKYLDDLVKNEARKECGSTSGMLSDKQIADLHDTHRDTGADLFKLRDAKAELEKQIQNEGEGQHNEELHAKYAKTVADLKKCEDTFSKQRSELKDYVPLNPVNLADTTSCDPNKFILDTVGLESQAEMDYVIAQEEMRGLINSPEVTESLGKMWGTFFSAARANAEVCSAARAKAETDADAEVEPMAVAAPVAVAGGSRHRYVRRAARGR